MAQPNDEPIMNEMTSALEEEVEQAIRQPRRPGPVEAEPARPVVPVAGAGAGAWGPSPPTARRDYENAAAQQNHPASQQAMQGYNTINPFRDMSTAQPKAAPNAPTFAVQIAALTADAERMIGTLRDMQNELAVIRSKLS